MNPGASDAGGPASWSLPGFLRDAVRRTDRRIVVVGARGWIGRSALELLAEAMGGAVCKRVVCFGSARQQITLSSGVTLDQFPLEDLDRLDKAPTLLFHLAFVTKDKVADMSDDAYRRTNLRISNLVAGALETIGVDRLFLASSGAAAFADDPGSPADLRLYGRLKRDDEELFADWAARDETTRRAAICRIYSVSGPFINKHDTYALADFILAALRDRPIEIASPRAVWRSYVAVREVVALALAVLLADIGDAIQRFDSGGEPMELGGIAQAVAATLGGTVRQRIITADMPSRYCGDHPAWLMLLDRHGLEHLDLTGQVRETAAYLAALENESSRVDRIRGNAAGDITIAKRIGR